MKGKYILVLVSLFMLCVSALGQEQTEIYNSWNTASVDSSPNCSPFFKISQPYYISYIDTYHWNYGKGTLAGGTISLVGKGTTYGPWNVETTPGQGGVPNAIWIAHPNVVIPAGSYLITSSDLDTWSANSESPCGFCKVKGYPVNSGQTTTPPDEQPLDKNAWLEKGWTLFDQGKYDEALRAFDRAIEIDPQYAKAWYGKGAAFESQGRYDEAINAFDRAIEINPQYASAWNGKGNSLNKQHRYNEALRAYDRSIEIDPQYANAWDGKGDVLGSLGRYTEADAALAKAKELGYQDSFQ